MTTSRAFWDAIARAKRNLTATPADWCRLAGWYMGNQEFKTKAKRLREAAFGFDPQKAS